MKRLWICGCFALLCGACDDKTADEPVWNGDNYVTAFSLTVGEAIYEAVVHDGRITVDVPYDASLDGAEVHYELCEHASIHPDPATIRDWSQEWQFLVSSYGQSDRTYIYTVNRTDVATGGSLTLRTQAEVDAFAASRINVVEGNLTIGVEGGEAIVNLDGLAGLVSVRCDLTVTNAYRGEDLAGLAGLRRCESLRIGSAGAPHETLKRIELPALREVAGDLQLCGAAVRAVAFAALQRVDGAFAVGSDALAEIVADELEAVGGDMRLAGSTGNAAKAPCEQMYFPKLQRVGGELSVVRFGRLGQLATTFGALASVGSIVYEELALTASCEFPLIETVGAVALTDCPALRTISLPRLAAAGSFSVEGCPAVETVDLPLVERFEGDVRLASLSAVTDFGALLPRLTAIGGDLTLDDLPGLAGVFDLSKYAFSEHSAVTLRFVSTPKLTELRGGGFAGSLSLDAAALAPQPETMPFALSGFERLDVLHVVGFKGLSALSLPVAACTDLLIENCGTQRAFALSLPALEEVRGTLLCKNCGKTGAANSASFPRLRSIGRQLAFYVNVSSFASLAFPELERVGDGLGVSDDASSDYAFYTMPSGCTGAFVLPKLKEVRGNMLLSTWNASTDRVAAFRFPALETVTGELFVGHASYKNRTVTALDFSALRQVGSVYVGNLSSATDFSTFSGALPSLSDATWRVENCGENPTYEQMLGGQTGRP